MIKKYMTDRPIPQWTVPIALLVLCYFSFGLLIPAMGFYWDDWELILVNRLFPASEFWNYFQGTRPLAGWTYVLLGPIVGNSPVSWHLYTLLVRWLAIIAMGWFLQLLWPRHKRQITYAMFLFAVYPVFLQQPIAVTYQQHWNAFIIFFLSMGLMALSIIKPKKFYLYTTLSLAGLLVHLSIFEYFVGVELLRPIIIFVIVRQNEQIMPRKLIRTFRYWLPYLTALLLFIGWRIVYSQTLGIQDTNRPVLLFGLLTNPALALAQFAQIITNDTIFIMFSNWYKILEPGIIDFGTPGTIIFALISILISFSLGCYLWLLKEPNVLDQTDSKWSKEALVIAICGMLLGSLPIWVTGRQSSIEGLNADRFAMVAMFGASLLWVVILETLIPSRTHKIILLSITIGLAAGLHMRVSDSYRQSWADQRSIYWQLYWRAPAIQPHTALLSEGQLFPYVIPTFSINLMYGEPKNPAETPYWFYLLNRDFAADPKTWLAGKPLEEHYREFSFTGMSQNSLVLYRNPRIKNCLWVLGPADQVTPNLPQNIRESLPLSALNRIIYNPDATRAAPAAEIFGEEPEHTWCYFYQKAELLRQEKNWGKIAEYGDEAKMKGYYPDNRESRLPHEWLPFIEGYAHNKRWEDAKKITTLVYKNDPSYDIALCNLWNSISDSLPPDSNKEAAVLDMFSTLHCLD